MGDFAKSFWGHALNTAATLVVAVLVLKGSKVEVEPEYVDILQKDLIAMRAEITKLQTQNISLTLKYADLTRMVGGDVSAIEENTVFILLGSVHRPAWCKRVQIDANGKPVFRMAALTYEYGREYGVSINKYIGGTDFDNHPQDIAEVYYQNDMKVYRRRDSIEFDELVDRTRLNPNASKGVQRFAKFWLQLPSGPEYICGILIGPYND